MIIGIQGFPSGSDGKESACNVGDQVWSLDQEDPLEKGMVTHFSILAWRMSWTEEPGGLQSLGVTKSQMWLSMHAHRQVNYFHLPHGELITKLNWFLSLPVLQYLLCFTS